MSAGSPARRSSAVAHLEPRLELVAPHWLVDIALTGTQNVSAGGGSWARIELAILAWGDAS
jgi:hypothetical protein